MARDAKGRFLPGPDGERHVFTKREQRKGYDVLQQKIHAGKLPSRVAAHLRRKIREWYKARKGRKP